MEIMTAKIHDCIIIGGGPAGVSAALYTKRANLDVLLIHNDKSSLEKAHSIENFYGFFKESNEAESDFNFSSGKNLYDTGIKQAGELGVNIVKDEVISIGYDSNIFYTVLSNESKYNSRAVLISTGTSKKSPAIGGLKEFEGRGVSYCAVCDAFFYRKKDVAVLGSGDYALHEAKELSNLAKSVTILTNGEKISADFKDYNVIETKIKSLGGENKLEKVIFTDDSFIDVAGLFIAVGFAGSVDFAKKIGAETDVYNGSEMIKRYENNRTSIAGLYAAGDNTGIYKQVAEAVYNGMIAAFDIIKYVRSKKT